MRGASAVGCRWDHDHHGDDDDHHHIHHDDDHDHDDHDYDADDHHYDCREEGYGGNNIVEEWGGNHWEQVQKMLK